MSNAEIKVRLYCRIALCLKPEGNHEDALIHMGKVLDRFVAGECLIIDRRKPAETVIGFLKQKTK